MTESEKPATTIPAVEPKVETPKKISITNLLHIIYITFTIGIIFGMIPFLGWIMSFVPIAGVMLAHIKKPEAKDPIEISHFDWQIKTFWVSFVATIIGYFTIPVFGLGIIILIARSIWSIYRIIKGWLALYEGKGVYPINWLF